MPPLFVFCIERALSAYLCFVKKKMDSVKKKNPEFKQPEVMRELGRLWKHLPEHKRGTYNEEAAEDRGRHEREMEAYASGGGASATAAPAPSAGTEDSLKASAPPAKKRKMSDVSDKSKKKKKKDKKDKKKRRDLDV